MDNSSLVLAEELLEEITPWVSYYRIPGISFQASRRVECVQFYLDIFPMSCLLVKFGL